MCGLSGLIELCVCWSLRSFLSRCSSLYSYTLSVRDSILLLAVLVLSVRNASCLIVGFL